MEMLRIYNGDEQPGFYTVTAEGVFDFIEGFRAVKADLFVNGEVVNVYESDKDDLTKDETIIRERIVAAVAKGKAEAGV